MLISFHRDDLSAGNLEDASEFGRFLTIAGHLPRYDVRNRDWVLIAGTADP